MRNGFTSYQSLLSSFEGICWEFFGHSYPPEAFIACFTHFFSASNDSPLLTINGGVEVG